jgi:hypothetical protein
MNIELTSWCLEIKYTEHKIRLCLLLSIIIQQCVKKDLRETFLDF